MKRLIIHIGLPRTGTTTLQKEIFQLTKKTLCLSKAPYKGSSKIDDGSLFINSHDPRKAHYENKEKQLYEEIFICSVKLSINRDRPEFQERLQEALLKTADMAENGQEQILLSTERLADTSSTLEGNSKRYPNSEIEFPICPLCDIAFKSGLVKPLITVCMREPIKYLRSKFTRTVLIREGRKTLRALSPSEYIQKQCILENNNPGTSALTPAMHSEFIKQLQQHAFVKAFGFQDLLASDDVFSLMGLQGEDKVAFKDFPRENKLAFSKEQEQAIEIEITETLKQYGFYERVMKTQIFE